MSTSIKTAKVPGVYSARLGMGYTRLPLRPLSYIHYWQKRAFPWTNQLKSNSLSSICSKIRDHFVWALRYRVAFCSIWACISNVVLLVALVEFCRPYPEYSCSHHNKYCFDSTATLRSCLVGSLVKHALPSKLPSLYSAPRGDGSVSHTWLVRVWVDQHSSTIDLALN